MIIDFQSAVDDHTEWSTLRSRVNSYLLTKRLFEEHCELVSSGEEKRSTEKMKESRRPQLIIKITI